MAHLQHLKRNGFRKTEQETDLLGNGYSECLTEEPIEECQNTRTGAEK